MHYAVGEGADVVRRILNDNPKADYHKIVGDLILRLTGLDLPRTSVKTINFGIIYGMAEPSLAKALKLARNEARNLMDNYHRAAPYARKTMDMCANEVHTTGAVRTILNRKSDFNSWGPKRRSQEYVLPMSKEAASQKWGIHNIERQHTHKALNRKLQGSAADIMKKAMVVAYEGGLFEEDACGIPILTVHDELDFEDLHDNPNRECWKELKHVMENCLPGMLRIPLIADGSHGLSWAEAH